MNESFFNDGATALDFVNTQMMVGREKRDLVNDWSSLVSWSVGAGLLHEADADALRRFENTPEGETALRRARELRLQLRELVIPHSSGREADALPLQFINELLRLRVGHPVLESSEEGHAFRLRHEIPLTEPLHLVARIAQSAAQLLCSAEMLHIKKCGNPDCTQLFLDTSKNKTRRWCSMALCGNRSKVALHHQRRKTQQEGIG